jgi:hypothetical protein
MKIKIWVITVTFALAFAAGPASRAATFTLPVNSSVSVSGPTLPSPGEFIAFDLNVSAVAPSFSMPCGVGLPQCDPATFSSLFAVLSISTSISEYDQAGGLIETTSLLSFFDNCIKPGVCSMFGRDPAFGPATTDMVIFGSDTFLISTSIVSTNITTEKASVTITFGDEYSATPLPGALPLFSSGLAVIGLLMLRRNKISRTM